MNNVLKTSRLQHSKYQEILIYPGIFNKFINLIVIKILVNRTAPVIEEEDDFIGCASPRVLSANKVEVPFQHATPLKPPSRVCWFFLTRPSQSVTLIFSTSTQ